MPKCKGVDIEDVPIASLQRLMKRGKLTSRDLVECYLDRIEQTNESVSPYPQPPNDRLTPRQIHKVRQ